MGSQEGLCGSCFNHASIRLFNTTSDSQQI